MARRHLLSLGAMHCVMRNTGCVALGLVRVIWSAALTLISCLRLLLCCVSSDFSEVLLVVGSRWCSPMHALHFSLTIPFPQFEKNNDSSHACQYENAQRSALQLGTSLIVDSSECLLSDFTLDLDPLDSSSTKLASLEHLSPCRLSNTARSA